MRKLLAILLRLAAEFLWPRDQRSSQVIIVPEPDELDTQECKVVRFDDTEELPRYDSGWHYVQREGREKPWTGEPE